MQRALTFFVIAMSFSAAALKAKSPDAAFEPSAWERQIVASCLVLEASNQGERGMEAVASVIANRAQREPTRYIEVVKTPYAFTSLNDATTGKTGSKGYAEFVRKASRDRNWSLALHIADEMYNCTLADITYGADHYSRRDQLPTWSNGMQATAVIGDHLFFKRI